MHLQNRIIPRLAVGFQNRVPGPSDMEVDVPVPLESPDCPRCGASVDVVEQAASVEDILPQAVRSIRYFRLEQGRSHVCKWTGRGLHEGLAVGQHGATAHRTGPHVMAQALAAEGGHVADGLFSSAITSGSPSPKSVSEWFRKLAANLLVP